MTGYVAYWLEHLRDGCEEGAKVFATKEGALEFLGKLKSGFAGQNTEVRLFELGQEIQIVVREEMEPQPNRVVRRVLTEA